MMFDRENDYGSSAAPVREDGTERPGNTWMFTATPIPNKHQVYGI